MALHGRHSSLVRAPYLYTLILFRHGGKEGRKGNLARSIHPGSPLQRGADIELNTRLAAPSPCLDCCRRETISCSYELMTASDRDNTYSTTTQALALKVLLHTRKAGETIPSGACGPKQHCYWQCWRLIIGHRPTVSIIVSYCHEALLCIRVYNLHFPHDFLLLLPPFSNITLLIEPRRGRTRPDFWPASGRSATAHGMTKSTVLQLLVPESMSWRLSAKGWYGAEDRTLV